MSYSRRDFLKRSSMAAAGAGVAPLLLNCASVPEQRVSESVSPSEKLLVGVIGCNSMGFSDMRSLMKVSGVECAALCDVDRNVLERRGAQIERITGKRPILYDDYRKLLEDRDIDAVVIGTPDHWHCLQMVDACEAGKDVYVEKPMGRTIEECDLMIRAAKRYNSIVQVGQWQRSGQHWDDAIKFVQSGELGRIRTVKAWAYMNWLGDLPVLPDGPDPDGVDYDFWLGPAPRRRFNENRYHFNFRWYWDYAGGLMTDWGVHLIDIVLYGMNATAPKSVLSAGGKFAYPDSAMQTPDTQQAIYEFDDFSMLWEHAVGIGLGPFQRSHGVAFIGNRGTLVVDRSKWEIFPETDNDDEGTHYRVEPMDVQRALPGQGGLDQHTQNFVECIKTRRQPKCPPEIGSLAAVNAHLGNIAFQTGRKVYWDEESQQFQNDREANELVKATYRNPWKLPTV